MATIDLKSSAGAPLAIASAALAVLIVSLLAIVLMISVAAMIFSGDALGGFLRQGIGLSLFGGVVLGIAGAFGTSFRGTICHPQDVTGVILALSAAAIAGRLGRADPGTLYATVAVLIAIASVVTGLAFIAAGAFRLGVLARFIPYPVMGGFLAAAGYLMAAGAVRMVTGQATSLADLAQPEALWRWLPVVGFGAAMLWVALRTGKALALPAMLALAFAGFYLWLAVSDVDLAEAGRRGLLLGPFQVDEGFLGAFRPALLAQADYRAILAEIPALATLVGLAFVGAMLNASGIELATGEPVDLNRDLRGVGIANLLAGLGGGVTGYHVLGGTLLANRLTGLGSRWIGVGVGLVSGVALVAGASLLSVLPIGVFAALLAFLGIDLLYQWLWVERKRLPLPDFLLVLGILAVAVTVGFLPAIGAGVLAASALFIVSYSRLDLIRGRLTGALRLSTTERPEPAVRKLVLRGNETLIFELQGYVFFGTAHALVSEFARDIDGPDATIRNVILDFRRVQGLDVSAVFNLGKLEQTCRQHGARLLITDLRPQLRRQMDLAGLTGRATVLPTLDEALALIEEEVLAEGGAEASDHAAGVAGLLGRAFASGTLPCRPEPVVAGAEVLRQGADSDCLILLESGKLSARVDGPGGGSMRVATFLPGAIVGEIGLYAGIVRTATVAADVDSTIRRVTRESLEQLSERDPALARDLHALVAALLARRLTRTTALLREFSRKRRSRRSRWITGPLTAPRTAPSLPAKGQGHGFRRPLRIPRVFRAAGALKDTLRSGHTAAGRPGKHRRAHLAPLPDGGGAARMRSAASTFPGCSSSWWIHDLGEAVRGDVPAPLQSGDKTADERADLGGAPRATPRRQRAAPAPRALGRIQRGLRTAGSRLAKGLDRLETVLSARPGRQPARLRLRLQPRLRPRRHRRAIRSSPPCASRSTPRPPAWRGPATRPQRLTRPRAVGAAERTR